MQLRRGFALLWVLVSVAILATLAGAAAPYLNDIGDRDRVERTAQILETVTAGIDAFTLTVKRGGVSWVTPNNLTLLTSSVVNGQPAGCTAQTYNATAVTNWSNNGPFVPWVMPPGGLWTPLGRLNNLPSRDSTNEAVARTNNGQPYYIQIPDVDANLAEMLDVEVDGEIDGEGGIVLYAPPSNGTVLLSYNITLAHNPAC